jgi:hypothetical protein
MTADALIAALQQLSPDQRQLPLIGHDRGDAYGEVCGVTQAALDHYTAVATRPCLYLLVETLKTGEWVDTRIDILSKLNSAQE